MYDEWIKARKCLVDEPKVSAIAKATGLRVFDVIGCLIVVWSWADGRTADGFVPFADDADIDKRVDCPGFAQAMVTVGWLELRDDGILFPEFEEHMGESSKKRAMDRRRKQKTMRRPSEQTRNISGTSSENVPSNPGTSSRISRTKREKENENRLIKEKEKKEKDSQPDGSDLPPDPKISKPEKLDELIHAFEALPPGIGHKIPNHRSKEVLRGWRRVQNDPEWRQAFEDIPTLMNRIRDGTFLHGQGWFKFVWLFAKGKTGEKNVMKILEGSYDERKRRIERRDPARIDSTPDSFELLDADRNTKAGT